MYPAIAASQSGGKYLGAGSLICHENLRFAWENLDMRCRLGLFMGVEAELKMQSESSPSIGCALTVLPRIG